MTTPNPTAGPTSGPAPRGRWKRPAYLVLVVAAFAVVVAVWFHTPTVEVESGSADGGYSTATCANAGPSRFDSPTVHRGQEVRSDPAMETFNTQVIKNDIESLRVDLACDQARDGHTNTLIVTTFAAGAALLFGYAGLWRRRAGAVPPTPVS
ncbi:hypothetical protein NY547_17895 [Cnuibacter physcomitrellae]|uniref:hypothetical protein n=1 Tax=Cnuibacter physcomitrellae TaxID=1619308 RepID=UPI0021760C16|nr:hypothetical protein [Cnuibacter physcomitrellae]MCS5499122.1 hypothetical protein [Cnuibacter physcomitrellae]